jgi:membrane-bound lytic murein transglycosylase B
MPRIAVGLLVVCTTVFAVHAAAQEPPPVAPVATQPPFEEWIAAFRAEAVGHGIRPEVLDAALEGLQPVDQILERDRSQAEFTLDLNAYLKRRLTKTAVRTAQTMYTKHRALLQKVGKQYGVSPRIIVAVWGLESNFGRFSGVRPTIPALATLAYDPRRATFFRNELFSALEILNRGDIELANLKGSWAGALGQPQFMPSTYLQYAQDFDGDGRRDIWSSDGDVFASVAFYLKEHGWTDRAAWGREVRIPKPALAAVQKVPHPDEGCRAEQIMTVDRPLDEWRRMGVVTMAGTPLPAGKTSASLVHAGPRAFLVYGNYRTILTYNCAHSYALSVALLADRLK